MPNTPGDFWKWLRCVDPADVFLWAVTLLIAVACICGAVAISWVLYLWIAG